MQHKKLQHFFASLNQKFYSINKYSTIRNVISQHTGLHFEPKDVKIPKLWHNFHGDLATYIGWKLPKREMHEKLQGQGHLSHLKLKPIHLTRELQDLMFVLLCFSLGLVQSSLTVSPFFSSGMLMVFRAIVYWEDVTCFQNVEDVTVSEFIRCYCQEIVLGARGDFVLLDSCRCGSLQENHCSDWIYFFIVDHEPILTVVRVYFSEWTTSQKQVSLLGGVSFNFLWTFSRKGLSRWNYSLYVMSLPILN